MFSIYANLQFLELQHQRSEYREIHLSCVIIFMKIRVVNRVPFMYGEAIPPMQVSCHGSPSNCIPCCSENTPPNPPELVCWRGGGGKCCRKGKQRTSAPLTLYRKKYFSTCRRFSNCHLCYLLEWNGIYIKKKGWLILSGYCYYDFCCAR